MWVGMKEDFKKLKRNITTTNLKSIQIMLMISPDLSPA